MSKKTSEPIYLPFKEMPRAWYNIIPDLPVSMAPALNPQTMQPVQAADLAAIFPSEIIKQEVSTERYIDIPEEVMDAYAKFRPAPLFRATRLEDSIGTPARIFVKYEGNSPAGSHKLNTAIAQAYYNKLDGKKRLATETGAGQWGSALSIACSMFGLECMVYMVRVSYEQKPYRKIFMQAFGSGIVASPSNLTEAGRAVLAQYPDSSGSLGVAISEAVEDAAKREDTNYALGSVLNHVVLHQTIIGQEAKLQMAKIDAYPDIVIGCCGGGSNFGGIAFPFVADKIAGKKVRAIAVEPASCPSLTRGKFAYDYGDIAKLTPLTEMYTLGHAFMPEAIHAGGLRYHGASPIVSRLYKDGLIEARSYGQTTVFEAALQFARTEGIVPAPESSHAIKAAIDEAIACRESGEQKDILVCVSGHGNFDMSAYDAYLSGKLVDHAPSDEDLAQGFACLPQIG